MNSNLKVLISAAAATLMAVALAGAASAQTKHPVHRAPPQAIHFRAMECADPGSHLGCPPAPTHINDAAERATGY
jgi:hypothetical protein